MKPTERPTTKSSLGSKITVDANLLPIKAPTGTVHSYLLTFAPALRRDAVIPMFERLKKLVPSLEAACFDGVNTVVTKEKIENIGMEIEVRKGAVTVSLEHKHEVFLTPNNNQPNELLISTLEVIMRYHQAVNYNSDGRRCFSEKETRVLTGGLIAWGGISQKVNISDNQLFLNVDMVVGVFYESISIMEMAVRYRDSNNRERGDSLPPNNEGFFKDFNTHIKNCKFTTMHRGDRNSKFKINGFSMPANKIKFNDENGNETTVADYFAAKYKPLRYPEYPCAVIKRGENLTHIPIEVIVVLKAQRYPKKLNDRNTSELLKFASKVPNDRFKFISNRVNDLTICDNPVLSYYGVAVQNKLTSLAAAVLTAPTIKYGNKTTTAREGSWNLMGCEALRGAKVNSAVCIIIDNCVNPQLLKKGMADVVKNARRFGMCLPNDIAVETANTKAGFINVLKGVRPELAFVILPDKSALRYQAIKRVAETECNGIITQCLLASNAAKDSLCRPGFCFNILIKVNAKFGGANWSVSRNAVMDAKTMVVGCDVTHPGIGNLNSPSISAVVCCVDNDLTNYITTVKTQERRTEIVADLEATAKNCLSHYVSVNNSLPENIIFFRDGVGESQFYPVFEQEIMALKKAISSCGNNITTKLTYIVAQKRHSVRFNFKNSKNGNVPVGTIVDSFGDKSIHDFYLVAHYALQGTARPIRYQVIHDECGFTRDQLYTFIHDYSYCYARATKAVSVVPAIYYAHLAAARANCYLTDTGIAEPPKELLKKLYYI